MLRNQIKDYYKKEDIIEVHVNHKRKEMTLVEDMYQFHFLGIKAFACGQPRRCLKPVGEDTSEYRNCTTWVDVLNTCYHGWFTPSRFMCENNVIYKRPYITLKLSNNNEVERFFDTDEEMEEYLNELPLKQMIGV